MRWEKLSSAVSFGGDTEFLCFTASAVMSGLTKMKILANVQNAEAINLRKTQMSLILGFQAVCGRFLRLAGATATH